MRVLQIVTMSTVGGAQSVVAHISNSLVDRGHEVLVVAGEGDGSLWTILDGRVEKFHCSTLVRSISLMNDFKTLKELFRIELKFNPHVIHLHSSKAGLLGRIVLPKSKIVYTVHGYDSIRKAFPFFRPIEFFLQYRCSSIVAVSEYDRMILSRDRIRYNVSCIYNGIPENRCLECLDVMLPKGFEKTVLCIARISPQKNVSLFLEIARLLPQFAFVWIGNSAKIVHGLDNVFFLGNIPEAGCYCKFCDCLILTSNYEGLPITIIEAMRWGKPVVASNVGGISEIVENGRNGFVSENSALSFKKYIEGVLVSDKIYESMSNYSRQLYKSKLTVDEMLVNYLNIYNIVKLSS